MKTRMFVAITLSLVIHAVALDAARTETKDLKRNIQKLIK